MLTAGQIEERRLHTQHNLLKLLFGHRINPLVPDSVLNPVHVLDCGYGSGIWASEVAESFPDAQVSETLGGITLINLDQVTGIDICPIMVQRNDRPDNFMPEVGTYQSSLRRHLPLTKRS